MRGMRIQRGRTTIKIRGSPSFLTFQRDGERNDHWVRSPPSYGFLWMVRYGFFGGAAGGLFLSRVAASYFFLRGKKPLTEWKGNFSFHLSFWAPKARSPGVTKFFLAPKYFCTMHLKREKGVCAVGSFSVLPTTINFFSFHLPLCPKGEADSERGTLDGETEAEKTQNGKNCRR